MSAATVSKPLTPEELKALAAPRKADPPVKRMSTVNIEALQLLADKYGQEATFPRPVGKNFDVLDYEKEPNHNGLYPPAKVGKLHVIQKMADWLDAQIENLMQTQFQFAAYDIADSLTEESTSVVPDDSPLRVVPPFRGELAIIRKDTGTR